MNEQPTNRNYKSAFLAMLVLCLGLLVALLLLWHARVVPASKAQEVQTVAAQTGMPATNDTAAQLPAAQETPPPAPVQLTPQRLQSIGVKFGFAEYKNVDDEIRATGNVDMDETRLSSI